ncbi:hypothetical protein GQ42DRAFT_163117 [Ramicandelaber brevisporus]|nr:hypothetical protein GQ42DRAFT_163117 [Ramicandelaber brevisporus]
MFKQGGGGSGGSGRPVQGQGRLAGSAASSFKDLVSVSISGRKKDPYPSTLNLYVEPPSGEITLADLEGLPLGRLHVLKYIETAQIRSGSSANAVQAIESQVGPIIQQNLPLSETPMSQNAIIQNRGLLLEQRHNDYLSHFILRLAFCQREDLRAWFLRHECQLFKTRLNKATDLDRARFLNQYPDILPTPITATEREELRDLLIAATPSLASHPSKQPAAKMFETTQFYKLDFELVPEMVQTRRALVHRGYVYIAQADTNKLIQAEFRRRLAHALEVTAKAMPRLDEDERLLPLLSNIGRYGTMAGSTGSGDGSSGEFDGGASGVVRATDVAAASDNFPLCMWHLHETLQQDGHMKHGGRIQFGLFLKGIGLGIEEALIYWRRAFRHMTDDRFQKEYAYNIRHNYGLEGKRVNYSPFNCGKIIMGDAPGAGQHHGCPYRHAGQGQLKTMLGKYSLATGADISNSTIDSVLKLAKDGHYQIACTNVLTAVMEKKAGDGSEKVHIDMVEHPNGYYKTCCARNKEE